MKKNVLKKYLLMFALFLGTTVGFSMTYEGDLLIQSQQDIIDFNNAGYTEITGYLAIEDLDPTDYPKDLTFPNLVRLGHFTAITAYNIEKLSFPKLEEITDGGFSLWSGYSPLTNVDLPELRTVDRFVDVSTNFNLKDFSLPKLETADRVWISGNKSLESVSFPSFRIAISKIDIEVNAKLTSIDFPYLESASQLRISSNPVIEDIEFPLLHSVNTINIEGNISLKSFSVPKLENVTNRVFLLNNIELTDLCGLKSAIELLPEEKFYFSGLGYHDSPRTYTSTEILDLNSDCGGGLLPSRIELSEALSRVLLSTTDETCAGNDGTVTLDIPGYEAGSVDVSTPGSGSIVVPGTQVYWSAVNMTSGVLHVKGTAVFYGDLTIGADVVGLIEGTVSVYGNLTIAGKVHNLGTIQATGNTTITGSLYNEATANITNLVSGSVTSGSPAASYSVVWEDGFEGITRSDLSEGTYVVTVTNLEGESGEIEVVVGKECVVPPGPTVVTPYPNPVSGVGDLTIQVTLPADEPNFELRLNSYWGMLLNEVHNGPLSAGEHTFTINIPNEGFYIKYLQYNSNGGSDAIIITRMPY